MLGLSKSYRAVSSSVVKGSDDSLRTWSMVRLPLFPGIGTGAAGWFSLLYLSHTLCGSGFQPGGTSSRGYLLTG